MNKTEQTDEITLGISPMVPFPVGVTSLMAIAKGSWALPISLSQASLVPSISAFHICLYM